MSEQRTPTTYTEIRAAAEEEADRAREEFERAHRAALDARLAEAQTAAPIGGSPRTREGLLREGYEEYEPFRAEQEGRGAARGKGPAREPVAYAQLAALLTDVAILYGVLPQGIDEAATREIVAAVLAMLGAHAGFGAAARQSVTPLGKE